MPLLLLLAFALPAPRPAAAVREWTVPGTGLRFEMSSQDLLARKDAGPVLFSMQAILTAQKEEFDEDARERARELLGPDPPTFAEYESTSQVTLEPLSVVGPFVSYYEGGGGYSPGAAHPYSYRQIQVREVSGAGTASLLSLYEEKTIVEALKADPWVRRFADEEAAAATTVKDLVDHLSPSNVTDPPEDCSTDAYFSADLVEHFAFHHLEGNRVAVRVGILYGSEVCRGTLHQVGLLLPIPEALREHLARAARREAGFLMKDVKAMGPPRYSASWSVDIKALSKSLRPR